MRKARHHTLFAQLWADVRGNALPIMGGIMILLVLFVGCAVDGTRMYMTNARLQQACDAGVLAGRKAMTDTSTSTTVLDATATAQANTFFANNIHTGMYGITSLAFTPSKTSDAQVAGTARAVLGMTMMRIFGYANANIGATCQARYDVADTDVIFVLDTTGSMACLPSDSDGACSAYVNTAGTVAYNRPANGTASGNDSVAGYPGSLSYYVPEKSGSRIDALRTAVLSFYDTMAASVDPSTHIRYGFVTYTSTVNAGKAVMEMSPAYVTGGSGSGNASWTYQSRYQTGTAYNNQTRSYQPSWQYQPLAMDITSYTSGGTITDPTKTDGSTTSWTGCLEEAYTTPGASSFTTTALPNDLNPDLHPNADIRTQWKPMWSAIIYGRNNFYSTGTGWTTGDSNQYPNLGSATYKQLGYVSCGKPVSRLKTMTRSDVSNYVYASDFRAIGGTYHDTGMIWGTRLLSPDGIFANDTAAWPGSNAPNRVIVFLTDGVMAPSPYIYSMYGLEYFDRRVSGGDLSNLTAYHTARFLAECAAAKNKNISIWTVALGMATTGTLQTCATNSNQALSTTSGSGLSAQFATIAAQVAKLRISK